MALALGTDEKKKLYILLGLLAAIVVAVVIFVVLPALRGSDETTSRPSNVTPVDLKSPALVSGPGASNTVTPAAAPAKAPVSRAPAPAPQSAAPPGGSRAGAALAASAPAGPATPVGVPLRTFGYREDPFAVQLPEVPVIPGVPRDFNRPGPVIIPRPPVFTNVDLLPPQARAEMLPMRADFGALPPVSMPPLAITAEEPRFAAATASTSVIPHSTNKRIAGVLIGDGIRVLMEITTDSGAQTTHIVQAGDEVDGIKVLRIERVPENGRTTTRLVVRERGVERYVDLRSGGTAPAAAAGGGGQGGGQGQGMRMRMQGMGGGGAMGGGGGFGGAGPIF